MIVHDLATFIKKTSFDNLSEAAIKQLKIRFLDSLKFSGGSFSLMPKKVVTELIDDALVSTGGFMEYVLTQGKEAVDKYIQTCKDYSFDIVELSAGFITLPTDNWLRLIEKMQKAGLKAKSEIDIQFGAGGDTAKGELETEGILDTGLCRQTSQMVYRSRSLYDHDRIRRHYRKCRSLENRRSGYLYR